MTPRRCAVLLLLLTLCACQHEPTPPPPAEHHHSRAPGLRAPSNVTSTHHLAILDPATLNALTRRGLDFYDQVSQSKPRADSERNNAWATQDRRYQSLIAPLKRALESIAKRDNKAGVTLAFSHRLFDARWLSDRDARFELIGVVNRADRQPFAPQTCGETRLIYRLRYAKSVKGRTVTSRLPMTVNVVYWQRPERGETCADVIQRWPLTTTQDTALARALTDATGPLARARLDDTLLKSVEVNLQSIRWPGTVHPSLGGHAEYLMRVFTLDPTTRAFVAGTLENTPDVRTIKRDKALRNDLLTWIKNTDHLDAIDRGIATLPERFLARNDVSVAPRSLARLANRPFQQLFQPTDFDDLDLSSYRHITSPAALIRRLDGLTCVGCHHSRSIAGFHLLGEETHPSQVVDALHVSVSPHFSAEQARRRRDLDTLSQNLPLHDHRPFAERQAGGGPNEHCGLGDPGFAHWTCDTGLRCAPMEDPEVGICVPAGDFEPGDPCETGRIKNHPTIPNRDRVRDLTTSACAGKGVCEANRVGFPGGMCARSCADPGPYGVCGRIPLLVDFNRCLAQKKPFAQCLLDNTRPAGMRACDEQHPCRDDYLCARTGKAMGACMPPYFLFQLRVDGHLR